MEKSKIGLALIFLGFLFCLTIIGIIIGLPMIIWGICWVMIGNEEAEYGKREKRKG